MRIETSAAGGRLVNKADEGRQRIEAVAPPEWLASLYSPAKTVFSAKKASDVLKWHPRIDLNWAMGTTLRWLEETGRLPAEASGGHSGGR
jgi:hypothetical protein